MDVNATSLPPDVAVQQICPGWRPSPALYNRDMNKFLTGLCCIGLLLTAGCLYLPGHKLDASLTREDGFRIWMMSDIQPRSREERRHFELAIDDMAALGSKPDMAIIAGDLLQSYSAEDDFRWFLQTRSGLDVETWYEIAGNHDARNAVLFGKYIDKPPYYGVQTGNLLILLLADETGSSQTNISDQAFAWWREMVINNQHRIIITVTHGQLQQSGLFGSVAASRIIRDSDRFAEVLKQYRVAVWASGHMHLPGYFPGKTRIKQALGGTLFINVSAIRDDRFMDIESRMLVFTEGSDVLLIRSRNHNSRRYVSGLDTTVRLGHRFSRGTSAPALILPDVRE
jgi:predicted phosphodiesterase